MYTVNKTKMYRLAKEYAPDWAAEFFVRRMKEFIFSACSATTYTLTAAGGLKITLYGCAAGAVLEYRCFDDFYNVRLDWEVLSDRNLFDWIA